MVEIETDPREIMKELKTKPKDLKKLLLDKSPDKKLLLYFSLGYLAEMYMDHAEEMMKEGKSLEKNYFNRKAMQIKGISRRIFGQSPDKDLYSQGFKVPKGWTTETEKAEINQLAQFCVQNLPDLPNLRDPEQIKEMIEEKLSTYEGKGVTKKFKKELKSSTEKTNNPTKLSTILEVSFILENVNEVLKAIKEEEKEEKQEEEPEEEEELGEIKKEGIDVDEIK